MIFSNVECEGVNVLKYFEADLALVFWVPMFPQKLLLEVDGDEVKVKEVLVLGGLVAHGTIVLSGDWPESRNSSSLLNWGWTRIILHRSGSQ